MTRTTNARLAGSMLLSYIVVGITSLVLFGRATAGAEGTAATLASIAENATTVRATVVLSMLTFVIAVSLAVALYALTRDEDRDLAALALCCRLAEAMIGAGFTVRTIALLWIATGGAAEAIPDAASANALGALLLKMGGWSGLISATCFAVGSTIFSYLFLRARSIPVALAWLGVVASVILVVALPLQMAGFLGGLVTGLVWLPMLVFEVPLGVWLLAKGVAAPAPSQ